MDRSIVLLSDGTGNSSVSPNKTNVWRLYQALNLGPDQHGNYRQIAFYDDGVGTSGFTPLRLLGGAFGWGLSRNVRQLYENLCRHYRPGDRIYIFGFSRGAFTARVLADFISSCGILDPDKAAPRLGAEKMSSDRGLRQGVVQAYKSYRRGYWQRASRWLKLVSIPFRWFRNSVLRMKVDEPEDFRRKYALSQASSEDDPLIEFIGVWDTVDAVGLPIDELSLLIDKAVYPYKFPDHRLSQNVGRGRQALAIDDKRHTFHPLLWDEPSDDRPDHIEQVWFTGMHANVGGGYPEDHLAYITLDWMVGEVAATETKPGLIFDAFELGRIKAKMQPLGRMYDSRRGAAVFYRYKPRDIAQLCNGEKVHVAVPKVHHSVLQRIADSNIGYAPTALPEAFHVTDSGRASGDGCTDRSFAESPDDRKHRARLLKRAKHHILWGWVAYFCMLMVVFALVLLPLLASAIPGKISEAKLDGWASLIPLAVEWSLRQATDYLPGFTRYWTEGWAQSPYAFFCLVLAFAGLWFWGRHVQKRIQSLAESAWAHVKGHEPSSQEADPGPLESLAAWLNGSHLFRRGKRWAASVAFPVAFLAGCLYLAVGSAYRVAVHYPFAADEVCADPGLAAPDQPRSLVSGSRSVAIEFDMSNPCFDTGLLLQADAAYKISIRPFGESDGRDLSFCGQAEVLRVDGQDVSPGRVAVEAAFRGFDSLWRRFRPDFLAGLPMRRHLDLPWFTLVGEIGRNSGVVFPLNRQEFTFEPAASGILHLYVNDAINALGERLSGLACDVGPNWDGFYENNRGRAVITVDRLPSD